MKTRGSGRKTENQGLENENLEVWKRTETILGFGEKMKTRGLVGTQF